MGNRGFQKLNGVTITNVSAQAVNQVKLLGDDGWIYTIDVQITDNVVSDLA
jgi:hypothetical protein